ncbi:Trypanosomal VSG domain/Trypanosome variant surface glycoprotein C-terminal domain containing protein, putative [Trypanosoma equiperdum]|uniref:Trypanosomal VSG domain/Trypanosome variant surface glycoprotein C-terminal domain containing protein, putative n=1 Tax=Trypanosoma equiperdum TaxID=5694 RepID=A0A1G4IB15_TRYEQ|nr:Trypanosomal VSG domain/Trypanosome variant surface glycoprotein C-terminal domain containing protein, putative [Trypanosoma equiperdum]
MNHTTACQPSWCSVLKRLLIVVGASAPLPSSTEATPLDSLVDFQALCRVYNLHKAKESIKLSSQLQDLPQEDDELTKLNISTATHTYFDHKDKAYDNDGTENKADVKKAWKGRNEEKIKHVGDGPDLYKRLPKSPQRDRANTQIRHLLTQHAKLYTTYKAAKEAAETALQEAKSELQNALYGPGQQAFPKGKFANGGTLKRHKICRNTEPGSADAAPSVAEALICMCTGQNGAATSECDNTLTNQVQDSNAGSETEAATAWAAIAQRCDMQPGPSAISAATVAAVAEAAQARLGALNGEASASNGRYTFGKTTANTCAGAQGATQCVNYKQQIETAKTGIPWINALHKAANKLTEAEAKAGEARAISLAREQLSIQARTAYISSKHDLDNPVKLTPTSALTGNKVPQEEDCHEHKSRDKCKEPCKWNENGTDQTKKCSLDPLKAAEQQTTQTGTGETATGTAATGCAKHGTDKAKGEGDKRCKWDGETCKESSLLLNKKLVLIFLLL